MLDFIYDASGRPFALKYTNGTAEPVTYYYILNLQGDVVGLTDADGVFIVKYSYNSWGEPITVTDADDVAITDVNNIAHINPLRYRGYYYDSETGFYYLQSRYYDPTLHRFINADCYTDTGTGFLGYNMFSYCNNNPMIYEDQDGKDITITIWSYSVVYTDDSGVYRLTISVKKVLGAKDEAESEYERFIYETYSPSLDYNIWTDETDLSVVLFEYKTASVSVSMDGITWSQTQTLSNGYIQETSISYLPKKGSPPKMLNAFSQIDFSLFEEAASSKVQIQTSGGLSSLIMLAIVMIAIASSTSVVGNKTMFQKT